MSKEIDVWRRSDGTVAIAQGDQRLVVPDLERLRALIAGLKNYEFLMSSKLHAQLTEEIEREEREREEPQR
jgi:hypothetical protein